VKAAAIPRSRAKTAWGLLKDVRKAILEEPLRVDMGQVVGKLDPDDGGPACGTVGCLAGWTLLLAGKKYTIRVDWESAVEKLLGNHDAVNYYTAGYNGAYVFNSGDGDDCHITDPGTQEHADAVVDRLDKFMQLNAAALKKKKLPARAGK